MIRNRAESPSEPLEGYQRPDRGVKTAPTRPYGSNSAPPASTATIRAALMDVIDAGCTCDSGEKHPWELDDDPDDDEVTENIVNAQRERFVDAVIRRIGEIQKLHAKE